MNEYFKKMIEARKKGLNQFEYKGTVYVKHTHPKTGMIMYKKK